MRSPEYFHCSPLLQVLCAELQPGSSQLCNGGEQCIDDRSNTVSKSRKIVLVQILEADQAGEAQGQKIVSKEFGSYLISVLI